MGLAPLAQAAGRNPRWEKLHTPSLFSAAVLLAGWALFGSLMLFVLGPSQPDFFLSGVFLTLTVFFLLVLRSSDWSGFPWVAGLTLTCAGLSFNAAWAGTVGLLPAAEHFWLGQSLSLIPTTADLFWLNLLLQIVPWWRKQGQVVSVRLSWQKHDLAAPFLFWPTAFLLSWLLWFAIAQTLPLLLLTSSANALFLSPAVLAGSLLTLSFLHLLWLHRTAWTTHVTLCSLFLTLFTLWRVSIPGFFHLPLFLALWSAVVLSAHFLWEKHQWGAETTQVIRQALSQWPERSLITAVAVLALPPHVSLIERLTALAIVTGSAASLG